jgi:hypothetical protein
MFYWVFCVAPGWARVRELNMRESKTVPQCDALQSRIRFWNESGTNRARIGDSVRMPLRSPQHLGLGPFRGTRSSFPAIDKPAKMPQILNAKENTESNQKRARVNRDSPCSSFRGAHRREPGISRFRVRCCASPRNDGVLFLLPFSPCGRRERGIPAFCYCVFATRGGVAWVLNWVASSTAVPSGVGMVMRNGTTMRVPAIGAKAISMLRWAVRYLITARSGM